MVLNVIENDAPRQEKPGQGKIRSVFQAARTGNKLTVLETLRDRVARDIQAPDTPPRDISSLSKRLMEIMDEIEVLKAKQAEEQALEVAGEIHDEPWEEI